jgi:hypothetical protein
MPSGTTILIEDMINGTERVISTQPTTWTNLPTTGEYHFAISRQSGNGKIYFAYMLNFDTLAYSTDVTTLNHVYFGDNVDVSGASVLGILANAVALRGTGIISTSSFTEKYCLFRNILGCNDIVLNTPNVIPCGELLYDDENLGVQRKIYVPDALVSAYKTDSSWMNFGGRSYTRYIFPLSERPK